MTRKHILITGGAGFIGSHLADELLRRGHRVRALDSLATQVHGDGRVPPGLPRPRGRAAASATCATRTAVERALDGRRRRLPPRGDGRASARACTSSPATPPSTTSGRRCCSRRSRSGRSSGWSWPLSMSIYGEGLYRTADGRLATAAEPSARRSCGGATGRCATRAASRCMPVPTPEDKPPALVVGVRAQQVRPGAAVPDGRARRTASPPWPCASSTSTGRARRSRTRTPGVLAIFAARYLNGNAPVVFEDGLQQRDFVSVVDVARACALALESERRAGAR